MFDSVNNDAWAAIYTRHQHEKVIARSLTERGFEVLLPLHSVVRRWKDRNKHITVPVFPCYIFIRGALKRPFEIVSTPGVHNFIGFAGKPASIPDVEIDAISRLVATGLALEPHPFLKCGDWVQIVDGPLTGIEGILTRKKNAHKLVLSVDLLKRACAVEIDASLVQAIARPPRRRLAGSVGIGAFFSQSA